MGFMDFMMNVNGNIEIIEQLADRLCDIAIVATNKMAECGVDGIITIDDLALQDRLMVSMEVFRSIFKPRFQRLYSHCHELGLDVFIHSCGYTIDIIEELISVGCDVVNLDRQDNIGMQELSKRYKGRVCFYCPLDIQRTLTLGKADIHDRVKEMIKAFVTDKGGFIAKIYPQPRAIGMTDEYLTLMTGAFKSYEKVK